MEEYDYTKDQGISPSRSFHINPFLPEGYETYVRSFYPVTVYRDRKTGKFAVDISGGKHANPKSYFFTFDNQELMQEFVNLISIPVRD